MPKLSLSNVWKTYRAGGESIPALKGVSMDFEDSEFVCVLGPSGCGKTTLLNVIGGLDRYDGGDLVIGGVSTKHFKDADWDAYRNRSVGFVFQSYNLISHQSVLQNVEISLTLSGVSAGERRRRAREALDAVGLSDQARKKPSQLSGGQMQRVAIARALVNNPDIILADEPTGALDSGTSVQIMELLREVAKTRLVIMVTHNSELAGVYASRVIYMLDGEVRDDSRIPDGSDSRPPVNGKKFKKTSMSMMTAASLSFRNLLTKKGRTIITAFAGSIGIIGVALVLALAGGLTSYMGTMQTDTLAGFPIMIGTSDQNVDISIAGMRAGAVTAVPEKFPSGDDVIRYDRNANLVTHKNVLTAEYLSWVESITSALPGAVNTVSYGRGVSMNLLASGGESVVRYAVRSSSSPLAALGASTGMGNGSSYWQEMPDSESFILSQYDLIGEDSRLPREKNEIAIVVDEYNRLDENFYVKLGITDKESYTKLSDFIGKTLLKVIPNDDYYLAGGDGLFSAAAPSSYEELFYGDSGVPLTVVGVLRIKPDAASAYFSQGIIYTTKLTDYVVETSHASRIAAAQVSSETDVITGASFASDAAREESLLALGADPTPTSINIYPVDFESKDKIKDYLDQYNEGTAEDEQVIYTDLAETITSVTQTLLNTVSLVLIGFAAVSLVVSTIMIGIITYVSVLERTKEIGILRSVGARKKDITRVFNAETLIVGFAAGTIGVGLAYLLSVPINAIINALAGISGIAALNPLHAVALVAGSMVLTLIAGLIPSRVAARKDPVVALRTE